MSWPQDGRPRYKLVALTGWHTPATGGTTQTMGVSLAILDRAVCHRVVRKWRTDVIGKSLPLPVILIRARRELERLEGGDAP